MSKAICFFHSADLDGHCSGAIVKHEMGDAVELRGINHGNPFPWDEVHGRDVIMVDFSLQPFSDMVLLHKVSSHLTWIDHHKSAIDDYNAYRQGSDERRFWDGKLEIGKGACELTWEYYYPTWKENYMPGAVRLLSLYDVWKHDQDDDALPFQFGMRMFETYPTKPEAMELWTDLFTKHAAPRDIISKGKTILAYQDQQNEAYANSAAFETELDGLKCIAINKMLTNSQMFDSVWDENKYDAMLTFGYRDKKWTFSLYATKPSVDVSVVAKARGGGGHAQAAGFQCISLPEGLLR